MRSFYTFTLIAFCLTLSACAQKTTTDKTGKTNDIVEDNNSDGDDQVEQVPGMSVDADDQEAEEVPGAEIEDEEPTCEFLVNTWDGEVIMGNTMTISLHDPTPDEITGETSDVLALDFRADDPNCHDMLVAGFSNRVYWTDLADSGWHPSWMGMSIDDELVDGVGIGGSTLPDGTTSYVPVYETFLVPAGKTITTTFSSTMVGAASGDTATFGLYVGGVEIYDGVTKPRTLRLESGIDGNTLAFE